MPIKVYNSYNSTWDMPIYDDSLACILDYGFKLRKHLQNGVFSFTGDYEDTTFTFPVFNALKLDKIIGIDYGGTVPDGTDVKFRISTDNNNSYQIYDVLTFAWRAAVGDEFISLDDLNSGMSILSLAPNNTFSIQMKLFANHEKVLTPVVSCIVFYFELRDYIPYQDLARSVKRFIEQNLNAKLRYADKATTISNIMTLDVNLNVKEIKSVYNLTTDSIKVYNLYDSYDELTKTITLNAMFAPGDVLEVNYYGCPDVMICQDPDYEESSLPKILIEITGVEENPYGTFYLHLNENPSSDDYVRMRENPIQKDYRVITEALCPSGLDSYAYAHALDKLLRGIRKIDAIESGAIISCVDFNHFDRFDVVSNNLKVKRTNFVAVLDDYFDDVEQKKKIQDIIITFNLTRKF